MILIIGSNSFSGATFISYLLSMGHQVIGTSRSSEKNPAFLPYYWHDSKNYQFFQIDLNHDLDYLMSIIKQYKPQYIFNFAAQSMVGESWSKPEDWMQTNVLSFSKLLNHLRNVDFIEKYIHISTPEVYGSCQDYLVENKHFTPSTPYAVSRAAADMLLNSFYDAYQFPVVTTRAANVYGPGQSLYRIIPRAILSIKLGKKLPLHGGGLSERSFIHMQDVSDATWKIATKGKMGDTYHIATQQTVTIRQLVEMICHEMKVDFQQVTEISDERIGKDQAYLLNSDKLRHELNWNDTIPLLDGIGEVIHWANQHFDILKNTPLHYQHKS